MTRDTHLIDASVLRPQSPEDFAVLFDMLESELAADIAGDRETLIQPLALLGVRYLAGHTDLRAMIRGEAGTGKTRTAKSLALHLGAPYCRISVAEMAETTWRGADLTNHIDSLRRGLIRPGVTTSAATALTNRAVVLIDDMDALRLQAFESYADSDKGQRAGRQASITSLWSGEDLQINEGEWTWSTAGVLVVGAGRFDGVIEPVDAAALRRWGLAASLAELLAGGTIIQMEPLPLADLSAVVLREAERLVAPAFEGFGYELTIAPATVHHAAIAARARDDEAGVRVVVGILRRAADGLLIRLVTSAEPLRPVTLAPDDL